MESNRVERAKKKIPTSPAPRACSAESALLAVAASGCHRVFDPSCVRLPLPRHLALAQPRNRGAQQAAGPAPHQLCGAAARMRPAGGRLPARRAAVHPRQQAPAVWASPASGRAARHPPNRPLAGLVAGLPALAARGRGSLLDSRRGASLPRTHRGGPVPSAQRCLNLPCGPGTTPPPLMMPPLSLFRGSQLSFIRCIHHI